MLFDGLFVPKEDPDGTVVWANPAGTFSSSQECSRVEMTAHLSTLS